MEDIIKENQAVGWIKIYRSLSGKAFYKRSDYVHLWLHLIIKSTHKPYEYFFSGEKIVLNPGQLVTGRKKLSEETGINESKIERILNHFEKIEHQIEQQKKSSSRLISIVSWNEYQQNEQQNEQRLNNERTTTEQRLNNERTTTEQRLNTKQEHNNIITKEHNNIKTKDIIGEVKTSLHSILKNEFLKFYKTQVGSEYYFQAKDGFALKSLIKQLKFRLDEKKIESSDENYLTSFQVILSKSVEDRWIKENLSLTILNSKLNEIIAKIKSNSTSYDDIRSRSEKFYPNSK